jgi:ubiquinone/menaquinone biosynthesis C-methylase UbiE
MAGSFETWRATTSIPGSLIPSRRFREVLLSARTLIDIGCGVGRLTAVLERKHGQTIGVDCNISALRSGAFIDVSSRIVGDARQLPFRDGVAHAVSLQAVLTVIPGREDQLRLASEASRVLTGGGVVYVADFLRNDDDPYYVGRYRVGPGDGVFGVTGDDGLHLYWAKHWLPRELIQLWGPAFREELTAERAVVSRSGRTVRGVELLLRKSHKHLWGSKSRPRG